MTSISSIGPSVAGYNYTLTCTATLIKGMSGAPNIWWTDVDGQLVSSSGDIVLYDPLTTGLTTTLTLYFDPIRLMNGGMYICMASVQSLALTAPLNSSTSHVINVLLSKPYVPVYAKMNLLLKFIHCYLTTPLVAYPITVTITDVTSPDRGTKYVPGSSVQLQCLADSRFAPVVTIWNSTCNGSCFVLQQTAQEVIMTDVLHSADSGNHSCAVIDDVGNTGHATIEMNVVGE